MYDERTGTHNAKILFEKGFDNVCLLSGGIDKFYENHHELVEGSELPPMPKTKTEGKKSTLGTTKTSKFDKTATSSMKTTNTKR